jgi:hypothetical protein
VLFNLLDNNLRVGFRREIPHLTRLKFDTRVAWLTVRSECTGFLSCKEGAPMIITIIRPLHDLESMRQRGLAVSPPAPQGNSKV